jgi:hypothetical protein
MQKLQQVMQKIKANKADSANTTILKSKEFGTRLSAHFNGHVNLSTNNGTNEQWIC